MLTRWAILPNMATDISNIELNDDQRRLLANAAENLGVPWQKVFEQAISSLAETATSESDNDRAETPYEILRRHGLIGCIEGTPPDLSTNMKHMQGYGKNG
jgi:hypothetical protein